MLATFFIIGGIWFWLLTAAALFFLLWEIHSHKPFIGLITVGLYLAMIHVFGDASVPSTLNSHPWILYWGIPIYVFVGVCWGLIKWILYVRKHVNDYKKTRFDFLRLRRKQVENDFITENTPVPENLKDQWFRHINYKIQKPSARENKWEIITWMCYWPVSMIWFVLDEPWQYLYEMLSSIFQKISDKIYEHAGYNKDVEVQNEDIPSDDSNDL